jgi:hypothetical protein
MADSPFFKAPHQRYPDLPQQGGLYLARNFDEVQRFISGPKGMTTLRVTSTTRPSTPYSGQIVYETDTDNFSYWGGAAWISLIQGQGTTYTPTLTASVTNPTLGTGGVREGRYTTWGHMVHVEYHIKFGTAGTNQGVGLYWISLPFPAITPFRNSAPRGVGWGFNAAANLQYAGVEIIGPPYDRVEHRMVTTGLQVFTDAQPFVWGANMEINGSLTYRAA